MKLLSHPEEFSMFTRVMFLKGRNKDNVDLQRTLTRISHEPNGFAANLAELHTLSRPGERIYASASIRSVNKASRTLKERMLSNDYNEEPRMFYKGLEARWASCLMNPGNEIDKRWLFDIDAEDDFEAVTKDLADNRPEDHPAAYMYQTKNGFHIIMKPFNPAKLQEETTKLLHRNPMMLWGY